MAQQLTKRFIVFCEPCSYKRILTTDKPDDMALIKVSAVPGGVPRFDQKTGKTVTRPTQTQCGKVKCPKCGRGVVVKALPVVYSKSYDEVDKRNQAIRDAEEKRKRIEDGTPIKPTDFLG